MKDTDKRSWIDQLEVTGPIKSIMGFVDELSRNYDKRIAAMHADYQKDVEEILACYKSEKQEFQNILEQHTATITRLESELKVAHHRYKTLEVEYKLSQDALETSKAEIASLTNALKSEEEFIALAKERIQAAQQHINLAPEISIATDFEEIPMIPGNEAIVEKIKKSRFSKTREFLKLIIADRLSRPIIIGHKQEPMVSEESEDQDTFSY